jgi:hypothetical protein
MQKASRLLGSVIVVLLLVFGASSALLAEYANYNRPSPLMDYVSQEVGVYDTVYWELDETDCRHCHGNSLVDRHHLTDIVVVYRLCTPCHEVIPEPPYVVIVRDCVTGGCHSWDDVDLNGWHHNTDLSASGNCVACHDPDLITEITPIRSVITYPPSIVTPLPFSCENCHWGQDSVAGQGPDNPGHPCTYDHYNLSGQFVGFYRYSDPIYSNFHTHHMGFKGSVSAGCYNCHSQDPHDPDWDPYNPELIRYCERCHSAESLHGIGPHLQDANGWEAVGFHVPSGNTQTRDLDPVVYRTWDPTGPHAPETTDGFSANEMCLGCHGDRVPDPPLTDPCKNPFIDNTTDAGIQPKYGSCGAVVVLRGKNFGEEQIERRTVRMKLNGKGNPWIDVPIVSWTKTRIEFQVPCSLGCGNYKVRVRTECGKSNRVNFALKGWISVTSASPEIGSCGEWITIHGANFGAAQSEMIDAYYGVHRVVDFVGSQGTYTARGLKDWTDTSIKVRFWNFFEDNADSVTGERNYIQDDGGGSCPDEPTVRRCSGLTSGTWSVYATAIYFGDEDGSGDLSCGDIIFQVISSDPVYFELTYSPTIYALFPGEIERGSLLKIQGLGFGPTQGDGEVRIGVLDNAQDPALSKGNLLDKISKWSNTLIKVKVSVPTTWAGKTKYVWVEKGGVKSNYEQLQILEPMP